MKNFTPPLLTFVLSLFLGHANAQCPLSGIILSNQAEINAFIESYPTCTEISGNLQIGAITSLSFNTNIVDFAGLENINSISGSLLIIGNNILSSIHGLDQLTHVGGDVRIDYNGNLTDLTGLGKLETIEGSLIIGNNQSLATIGGLQKLISVGGDMVISQNNILSNLNAFEKLTTVAGYLSIWQNSMLSNVDEFEKLSTIGDNLIIDRNSALENLNGFESLETLGGDFNITFNSNLTEIGDLRPTMQPSTVLRIALNPGLSDCSVQTFCEHISNEGDLEIFNNGIGCNSIAEIENSCATTLPVELSGFRAEVQKTSVLLTWQTLTETNNEGFYIERSNDATKWENIGWEAGQGNITTAQMYSFKDNRPMFGKSYYRLAQTDFNRKVEYSQIETVSFYNGTVSVYPNPVSDVLKITTPNDAPIESIVIYNTSGSEVLRETSGSDSFNVAQLNTGTYIIAIQVDGETIQQKVIVE